MQIFIPLLIPLVASAVSWDWALDLSSVPQPNAITSWTNPQYESQGIELSKREHTEIPPSCPDKRLYPTHPQQFTKIYHVYRVANYNNRKVPYDSEVCLIASRSPSPAKRTCLLTDTFIHSLISDTFQDSCGNLYRGVWVMNFLKKQETIGTLFSKGRTLYEDPNSPFEKDMIEGQTYPSTQKEFLFLTPLFPGDKELIEKMKQSAQETHAYNPETHLFTPIAQ